MPLAYIRNSYLIIILEVLIIKRRREGPMNLLNNKIIKVEAAAHNNKNYCRVLRVHNT